MLSNRKDERRRGKVQLINAVDWFTPLRKNLGEKGVEVSTTDADKVLAAFNAFDEFDDPDHSKIFDGEDFGYSKIVVERPLSIRGIDSGRAYKAAEIKQLKDTGERDETAPPVIKKVLAKSAIANPLHGQFVAVDALLSVKQQFVSG